MLAFSPLRNPLQKSASVKKKKKVLWDVDNHRDKTKLRQQEGTFCGWCDNIAKKTRQHLFARQTDWVRSNLLLKLVRYFFFIQVGHFVFSILKRDFFFTLCYKVEKRTWICFCVSSYRTSLAPKSHLLLIAMQLSFPLIRLKLVKHLQTAHWIIST